MLLLFVIAVLVAQSMAYPAHAVRSECDARQVHNRVLEGRFRIVCAREEPESFDAGCSNLHEYLCEMACALLLRLAAKILLLLLVT
jgi:hypothetical protein